MNKKTLTLLLLASITLLSVAGVKVSKLTRTTSFASNDLFIVVTGSTTKVTRHVRAKDLAEGLGPWLTNASMAGGSATNAVTSTNGNQFAGVPLSIKTGSTETNKVFYPSTINARPVTIYGVQGQDADLLRVNDYLGNILFGINYDGSLFGEGATDSPRLTGTSTAGYVWTASGTDGKGSWVAASGGISASNANQFGSSTTLTIKDGALLTNTSVRTALTLPTLTASRAAVLNSSGQLTNSAAVSDAELEYLDGVTSAIQTQIGSKQAGTFLLTNFIAMGITNIVSANANTVITTNSGVLTLTTAGTGSPGGNSAAVQFNQSGAFAGTNTFTYDRTNNTLTAGSFIGSGTGTPILKLQTMMSADNAFAISVRTNFTQSTTNFFEVTNAVAGQAMVLHSAAAGQLVWTNTSRAVLTNMVGMSFDYGLLYAATNTVAGTNFAINFSPNNTNHIDFFTTNWWCQWTNISGLAQGSLANKTIRITPSAPGQNLTNIWPVGKQHGIYQWNTNANSPIWTVLTNAKTYVLSLTAYGTNIHASMSLWEP